MVRKLELILEYIKVLIWPMIVIILLALFWSPLKKSSELLPRIIKNSESITIGGLSLKVNNSTTLKPTKGVNAVLGKMTKEGVNSILISDGYSEYFHSTELDYGRDKYSELITLRLYTEIPDNHLSEDPNGNRYSYGVQPTELGIETHNYVLSIVHEILQEIEEG